MTVPLKNLVRCNFPNFSTDSRRVTCIVIKTVNAFSLLAKRLHKIANSCRDQIAFKNLMFVLKVYRILKFTY